MNLNKRFTILSSIILIFILILNINLVFAESENYFYRDSQFDVVYDNARDLDVSFFNSQDEIEYENYRGSVQLTQNVNYDDKDDSIQNIYTPKKGEFIEIVGYNTSYNTDVVPSYNYYYEKYKNNENIRAFEFNDDRTLDKTYSITKTKNDYHKEIYNYTDKGEKELLVYEYANPDSFVCEDNIRSDYKGNKISHNFVIYENDDYNVKKYINTENDKEIIFYKEKTDDEKYQLEKKYIENFGEGVEYQFVNSDSTINSNRKYFDDTDIDYFNDEDLYIEMGTVEFTEDNSRNYNFYKEYNEDGTLNKYTKK
jgi:hypothetical protein